jgi:hypothetical protein
MTAYRAGDVVRYHSERTDSWCREGLAVAKPPGPSGQVFLVDTYWSAGGDDHVLTDAELETAELLFNLGDYRQVRNQAEWNEYHPDDRQLVTAQRGLQKTFYVRADSKPDLATKVENARLAVVEADEGVAAARRKAQWCREQWLRLVHELAAVTKADRL